MSLIVIDIRLFLQYSHVQQHYFSDKTFMVCIDAFLLQTIGQTVMIKYLLKSHGIARML